MRRRNFAILFVVLALGAGTAINSTYNSPDKEPRIGQKLVQQYSNRCQTPDGLICYVSAMPVGSPCECPGPVGGTIIR